MCTHGATNYGDHEEPAHGAGPAKDDVATESPIPGNSFDAVSPNIPGPLVHPDEIATIEITMTINTF